MKIKNEIRETKNDKRDFSKHIYIVTFINEFPGYSKSKATPGWIFLQIIAMKRYVLKHSLK